ncbi:MAG: hypothetical protein MJZ64_00420 [Paludibacteraceae bacterium]|nr:hypothetical protein [Paludibacteraceae bacterium]
MKRKRLGSFLALEINCAVLMMDIILLCCGCHLLTTCAFIFVVLLYNYGWFRCELDKYKDMLSSKREVNKLNKEVLFWCTAFRIQYKGEKDSTKGLSILNQAMMKCDFEDCIMFGSRPTETGGILSQIKEK